MALSEHWKQLGHPHAALPYAEPRAFMTSREPEGIAAPALEFAILAAVRTSEAIGAAWDEIEGDIWTVPEGA